MEARSDSGDVSVSRASSSLDELVADVGELRRRMLEAERENADRLAQVRDRHRASARNLIHYVAVRNLDLRGLQTRLGTAGVSSLGRMEAGVLGRLDAVLRILAAEPEQLDRTPSGAPRTTLTPLPRGRRSPMPPCRSGPKG